MQNNYLIKNKRKKDGYLASYTYEAYDSVQYIYVKHEDDVRAIDLLIKGDCASQAIILINGLYRPSTSRIFLITSYKKKKS